MTSTCSLGGNCLISSITLAALMTTIYILLVGSRSRTGRSCWPAAGRHHRRSAPGAQSVAGLVSTTGSICYFQIGGGGESQRDSATKPRVARNELPWDSASDR